ncbi:MAG TPA: hypothetical protein VHX59_08650 [Mycobacteriales bacterium]|jgi:hypothetical protein|nr:hypothetical protein [Mycobacteriales bacterium]
MSLRLLRLCAIPALAVGAIVGVTAVVDGPASASPPGHIRAASAPIVDGFAVSWLPDGLGPGVSDFSYSFDEVDFRSKVWESGPDADGAYHQDLSVDVLRGSALSDSGALYRFLTDYEQRPPAEWRFVPFSINGHAGYLGRDEAFWVVRPGVAVKVAVDRSRFHASDVLLIAEGIHEVGGSSR